MRPPHAKSFTLLHATHGFPTYPDRASGKAAGEPLGAGYNDPAYGGAYYSQYHAEYHAQYGSPPSPGAGVPMNPAAQPYRPEGATYYGGRSDGALASDGATYNGAAKGASPHMTAPSHYAYEEIPLLGPRRSCSYAMLSPHPAIHFVHSYSVQCYRTSADVLLQMCRCGPLLCNVTPRFPMSALLTVSFKNTKSLFD